ncbi:phage antirepressor protein KilAC domain-containing protein [Rhizobium sp. PP-WC-2G-219]|nr:phage antirepressor protein KilAC domain-containing protein [Rhizobium sp. PP-WC-2G-219]
MSKNRDGEAAPNTALTLEEVGGELRIEDTVLAKRLGFSEPKAIRKLIKRHATSLEKLGTRSTVSRVVKGGEAEINYLTRRQAVFITAKSETEVATEVTIEIVKRFDELEQKSRENAPQFSVPRTLADALRLALEQTEKVERQAQQIDAMRIDVDALGRIAKTDGLFGPREAAQILQMTERRFIEWLERNGWCYRPAGKRTLMAYAEKRKAGLATHKLETFTRPDGSEGGREALKFTPAGMASLAAKLNVSSARGDLFSRDLAQ